MAMGEIPLNSLFLYLIHFLFIPYVVKIKPRINTIFFIKKILKLRRQNLLVENLFFENAFFVSYSL